MNLKPPLDQNYKRSNNLICHNGSTENVMLTLTDPVTVEKKYYPLFILNCSISQVGDPKSQKKIEVLIVLFCKFSEDFNDRLKGSMTRKHGFHPGLKCDLYIC